MQGSLTVGAASARAISFLASSQAQDGAFDTFYSPLAQPFEAQAPYRTTFLPALILQALGGVEGAGHIRTQLADWLIAQRSPEWGFNYWPAGATERSEMTYPDDLDDTFCVLSGLWLHNHKLVDPEVMGKAVRILLATEMAVGGPYRTWIVPPGANKIWLDVDLAVNANVAYFLRLVAQPLPNINELMEQAIASKKFTSPYYPSAWPIMYYIGRAYRGAKGAALARYVQSLQTEDGNWGTPMHTALAVNILHEQDTGADTSAAISYLLGAQQADGSWPAEPFWLEVKQTYSGSAALSTALVLEALSHGSKALSNGAAAKSSTAETKDIQAAAIYTTVMDSAKQANRSLPAGLRASANATLTRMARSSTNREIVLLPYFFAQSQTPGAHNEMALGLLQKLGLANMHGWAAYTIYDDLLDGDGDIRMLPLANAYMRLSLDGFLQAAPHAPAYQAFVRSIFNRIDAANAWEAANCRFVVSGHTIHIAQLPDYGNLQQLAERSLGHALPAIALLAHQGIMPSDPHARSLLKALTHYLMARQLGDDIQDWEIDLRSGQCSAVVAHLLRSLDVQPGTHRLEPLVKKMRKMLARDGLQEISGIILGHTEDTSRYLQKSSLVRPGSPIAQLSEDIADIARAQLQEQHDARTFLAAYSGK
jgi:hypothetical protein